MSDERGVWQVIEGAGGQNERVVSEWDTYLEAFYSMCCVYTAAEREHLGVDILHNGSTEY